MNGVHHTACPPSCRADEFWPAVIKTALAVVAATVFGLVLGSIQGRQSALEFFSGYIVEQSLSVDNLFVFVMLFEYFRVPSEYQQRVLTWGIVGAILMRGAMIVAGVAAVRRFRWMTLLFAGVLFLSSVKLLMESDDDDAELADNFVVRLSRRLVGATSEYDGDRFFTEDAKKRRRATPLFLTLVCVELSDVVFAVDSIPAVLGISTDPFVVYASNVFAIAGLRALYALVARAVDSMVYLKPAVCLVLLFISLKMILEYFHYALSTTFSLGVVLVILAGGVVLSVASKPPKRKSEPEQHHTIQSGATTMANVLHRRAAKAAAPPEAYSIENDLSQLPMV
ncbi:hypothetical protein CTAYLR_010741 [Chrysophaeum taylorii]|uniref:Integral membrane protein TerC n=1 Tax=Chrysophaeum taylorii TaxID=2483200 RepID=A0AAD7U6H0_9STRA|nr:hypothetical protein CTAYLR_010741 [Chrysophaeum taylorii]